MLIDIILYSIALIALAVGSYTDLKTREVPDWLSYGLIFSGLGLRLLFSAIDFNWGIFMHGFLGFVIFVGLAYLMYYAGQWGGGDSKLLMGLGALIGIEFTLTPLPTLLILFINLLVIGAVYGSIWILILAVLHKDKVLIDIKQNAEKSKRTHLLTLIATILLLALVIISARSTFLLPTLIILALSPIISYYLWLFVKSVEHSAMYKSTHPEQLTEGDWIAYPIYAEGKLVAGPKDLGISRQQIHKLMFLHRHGKLRRVIVREGIPFVPSFLIAFIMTISVGDWISLFL